MEFLKNKRALITGIANKYSIAFGITQALKAHGAELAFTYQGERLKERVENVAKECGSELVFPCDVNDDNQIETLFNDLSKTWDQFDILIHSIAFAPSDQLEGDYIDAINREGFKIAHEVSSYSFAALAKAAYQHNMLREGASLITLTYLGAEKAVPNYNVMGLAKASLEANVRYLAASLGPKGVRVNGISAGPIKTLAASGVKNLKKMLDYNSAITPLRKNVTIQEVGNTAAFLGSDLSAGITGEIIHVDAGYHAISMQMPIEK